jgi:hypothetical protein
MGAGLFPVDLSWVVPVLAVDTRSWRGLHAHPAGVILLFAGVAQIRRQAFLMFALIIPALLPFILLGTVMGLSWWEDRLLPPTEPANVLMIAPTAADVPTAPTELGLVDAA